MARAKKYQDGRSPGRGTGIYLGIETEATLRREGIAASALIRIAAAEIEAGTYDLRGAVEAERAKRAARDAEFARRVAARQPASETETEARE